MEDLLIEMAREEGRDDLVTAYAARRFFESPSSVTFKKVRDAAKKPGSWDVVREALMKYLETGSRPDRRKHQPGSAEWPLPPVELPDIDEKRTRGKDTFPMTSMLLEIALLEKRNDDAVAIYTEHKQALQRQVALMIALADAVVETHPDIFIRVHLAEAISIINRVNASDYPFAVKILARSQKVCRKNGRQDDWSKLLAGIRTEHRAKPV